MLRVQGFLIFKREIRCPAQRKLVGRQEPLHRILQFPYISRPFMSVQRIQNLSRQPGAVSAGGEPGQKSIQQQGDIFLPLPQRREGDFDDVNPIKQILPELALADQPGKVLVGRADNPHIRFFGGGPSHRHVFAVLQNPEQLHLHGRIQFTQFIQKQRAPVGCIEIAGPILIGVRKAPFPMPEKFALEQGFRHRAAVDRDKRFLIAPAQPVDGPGRKFLAGAGIPVEDHMEIRCGRLCDQLVDRLHGRTSSDDLSESVPIGHTALQDPVFVLEGQFFPFHRPLEGQVPEGGDPHRGHIPIHGSGADFHRYRIPLRIPNLSLPGYGVFLQDGIMAVRRNECGQGTPQKIPGTAGQNPGCFGVDIDDLPVFVQNDAFECGFREGFEMGDLPFEPPAQLLHLDMGFDPGQDLFPVEGFCDVIDAPGFEALGFVLDFTQGAEKNHRYFPRFRPLFQFTANLVPAHAGHQDIQQDQVRRRTGTGHSQSLVPVFGDHDSVGAGQKLDQNIDMGFFVIHHQDFGFLLPQRSPPLLQRQGPAFRVYTDDLSSADVFSR